MDWTDFFSAIALLLIIEGLMPFFNPKGWKGVLIKVLQMDEKQLRFLGLTSMVIGIVILNWVR